MRETQNSNEQREAKLRCMKFYFSNLLTFEDNVIKKLKTILNAN